jgi:hypothetical protein
MEFVNDPSIDVKDWKEINPRTYRSTTNLDPNTSSASTSSHLKHILLKIGMHLQQQMFLKHLILIKLRNNIKNDINI